MNNSARMSFVLILAAGFLSACAGGRQKQAVSVQPAPGSTQPAADANGGQQTQQGGEHQGDVPVGEGEQTNPGSGEQPDLVPTDDNGEGTTSTPGSNNNNEGVTNGTTTNLVIEATLDNGVASDAAWDGKSFKGSGKWKVEPMP